MDALNSFVNNKLQKPERKLVRSSFSNPRRHVHIGLPESRADFANQIQQVHTPHIEFELI
jgi:hypothetical protein